jgi:serine/threonine-protein kinase
MDPGGRTLARRYQLDGVIGRGGMSTVYRATDLVLDRTVAVKVLLASLADEDPAYVARFQREARAAAALANSSVVTVYDTGVDDGARFIVMEHVQGHSLAALLERRSPLPVEEALRIAGRVAAALATAHAAGILHRDIKPANVMVADDGTIKVLDFGIARKLDGTTITQTASVVGTAAYMAPERALGKAGDARADVYSLGCLLYAMLTRAPPFGGDLAAMILHQQINAEPRPPSELRAEIPAALDLLVLAMLAKDPEHRPQTAAEVRDELTALEGSPSRRGAAAAAPISKDVTAPTARLDRTAATRVLPAPSRWGHRRRAIVMAVATGVLAFAVIAVASGGSGTRSHRTPPTGTTSAAAHTTSTHATTERPATRAASDTPPPAPAGSAGETPGQGGEPPGKAKKPKDGGDGGD